METSKTVRNLSMALAGLFALAAMIAGYRNIGIPPVVIVGGSSLIGLVIHCDPSDDPRHLGDCSDDQGESRNQVCAVHRRST